MYCQKIVRDQSHVQYVLADHHHRRIICLIYDREEVRYRPVLLAAYLWAHLSPIEAFLCRKAEVDHFSTSYKNR